MKKKNNLPGPGSYYYKDAPCTKELTFPMETKFRKKKLELKPGPGMYRIPCSFNYLNEFTRMKGNYDPTFKYI